MHVNNLYCSNCINPKIFRLNLFTKIFSFLLSLAFIILNHNLLFLGFYFIILLILIRASGFHLKNIFKYIKDLWFINILLVIACLLTINIYLTIYLILSFQIVFIYGYFIYSSSSPIELKKCFVILFKPLGKIKINYNKLADKLVDFISFLPELVISSKNVVNKEKSRGVDITCVDLKTKLKAYCNMFTKGLELTQRKLNKQKTMKKFMLYNDEKKAKLKYKGIESVDFIFVIIHLSMFLLIIYEEEIYYEMSFIPFL